MRAAPDATHYGPAESNRHWDIEKRGSAAAAPLAIWRAYDEGLSRRACLIGDVSRVTVT